MFIVKLFGDCVVFMMVGIYVNFVGEKILFLGFLVELVWLGKVEGMLLIIYSLFWRWEV